MTRLPLFIALGSAIGGLARYSVATLVQTRAGGVFPLGTLVVNVSGSLALGVLLGVALETPAITPEWRAFLAIGLCGGYTTFSTFSYETLALLQGGDYRRAALYIIVSVFLALGATLLGLLAARELVAFRHGL